MKTLMVAILMVALASAVAVFRKQMKPSDWVGVAVLVILTYFVTV